MATKSSPLRRRGPAWRSLRALIATLVIGLALSFTAAQPGHAMIDGDYIGSGGGSGGGAYGGGGGAYGEGGGHYFNPLAPLQYAFKAVGYALKVPIYALQASVKVLKFPLSFFQHRDGYEAM